MKLRVRWPMLMIACYAVAIACAQSPRYAGRASDTVVLRSLIDSVNNQMDASFTSCEATIGKALSIVHKSDNQYYAALLIQRGYIFYEQQAYASAAAYFDSAANIYDRIHDVHGLINCLNKAGNSYVFASHFRPAVDRLFRGVDLAERRQEPLLLSSLFVNAGLLFESLEDYDNALRFAKKALPLKQQLKDTAGIARIYNNIGNLYAYTNRYDSAIANLTIACKLHQQLADSAALTGSLMSLGSAYLAFGKYHQALNRLQLAEQLLVAHDDQSVKPDLYANLSLCYLQLHQLAKAGQYAHMANAASMKTEDISTQKNVLEALYKYHKATGNAQQALHFFEAMKQVDDTLNAETSKMDYQRAVLSYEMNKKAAADSLEAEQRLLKAKSQTAQTRVTLLIVALAGVIAVAVAIILYNRGKLLYRNSVIARQDARLAEQETATYQLKTLQAQMNPHFVFNCFNTIDSWILQNKQLDASILVQRFSRLSRRILEQTAVDSITFEEEADTLTTYVQIEQMRGGNSFDFNIAVAPTVMGCRIPPMLLQPFVENAILHGVRHLTDRRGVVEVQICDEGEMVKITVLDNGIGLQAAARIKQQKQTTHQSMSMMLTIERLKALHQHTHQADYLFVGDNYVTGIGTLVSLLVPKKYNNA